MPRLSTLTLTCYHHEGLDTLMWGLESGTLDCNSQKKLHRLLGVGFANLPTYFEPDDVIDFEIQNAGKSAFGVTFTCPICDASCSDVFDILQMP